MLRQQLSENRQELMTANHDTKHAKDEIEDGKRMVQNLKQSIEHKEDKVNLKKFCSNVYCSYLLLC